MSSIVLCACETAGAAHQNRPANIPNIAILRIVVLLCMEHLLRVKPYLFADGRLVAAEGEAASPFQIGCE